jgi:hypothetical protein
MNHAKQFDTIVLGAITEFLSEIQPVSQIAFSIHDLISPSITALQVKDCNRDEITAELCHRLMWHYKRHLSLVARYKLLTILFPVCRTFIDVVYYSLHECKACGNSGWWCRGCGGSYKIQAMKEAGLENAEEIRDFQFAGCEEALVPCFLCNRNGLRPNDEDGYDVDPDFWESFLEESSVGKN